MMLCSGHPRPESITPIGPWNKLTEGDHRLHPTVQSVILVSRSEVIPWRNGFTAPLIVILGGRACVKPIFHCKLGSRWVMK